MLTHDIEANSFLIAETKKYDDKCVQDYVCRRLYGGKVDDNDDDDLMQRFSAGSSEEESVPLQANEHETEVLDTDSVQIFDSEEHFQDEFDAARASGHDDNASYERIIDDDDNESMRSFDADLDLQSDSDSVPDNDASDKGSC